MDEKGPKVSGGFDMRRLSLSLIAAILCLTFLLFGCGKETKKTFPQAFQDKIVFVCGDNLCTINPDGSDLKVVASSKRRGAFSRPSWSSNKEMIGATVYVRKTPQIILVNSDGSNLDTLGLPAELEEKIEHPRRALPKKRKKSIYFRGWTKGDNLMFSSGAFEGSRIGVMNTKGEIKKVLRGNYPHSFGDKIVYLGYSYTEKGLGTDIFVFDFKTGRNFNLTGDRKIEYYLPVGSPEGEKIAFGFTPRGEKGELWVMNSDGTGKKILAKRDKDYVGTSIRTIEFSPDGKKILFVPDNGGKSEIYVINTDGTNLKGITGKVAFGRGGASWSSDGKKIVFTSNKDGNEELYIVNADGTGLKRLTNNDIKDCYPDW